MAVKFPYATTVHGLSTTLRQLRSAFPPTVTADTLKKWGIAPGNESSIVQTLRFLNLVNDDGAKNPESAKAFLHHEDEQFAEAFGALVRKAYADLFDHLGENAWNGGKDQWITFFRGADQTSARVGEQQAATFGVLVGFAGHAAAATSGNGGPRAPRAKRTKSERVTKAPALPAFVVPPVVNGSPLTVSVRVELNLPVTDDQTVYDKIFRSIRENLINA